MLKNIIKNASLLLIVLSAVCSPGIAKASSHNTRESNRQESVNTDAGEIDFRFLNYIKMSISHSIKELDENNHVFILEDGSKWNVSKFDIIKSWQKGQNLIITQNHAFLSHHRFALLNLELKVAVPISLVREPALTDMVRYIIDIDKVNDAITLNDGKRWVVHSFDHGTLSRFSEHDRVIIGADTSEVCERYPYIIIDTAINTYVRGTLNE